MKGVRKPQEMTELERLEARARREHLELTFLSHLRAARCPEPLREYPFHPERKWRFDFAWPDRRLAVEIEGLSGHVAGRHQRIEGYEQDCIKYAEAALLNWLVIRFTGSMVHSGLALTYAERFLARFPSLDERQKLTLTEDSTESIRKATEQIKAIPDIMRRLYETFANATAEPEGVSGPLPAERSSPS